MSDMSLGLDFGGSLLRIARQLPGGSPEVLWTVPGYTLDDLPKLGDKVSAIGISCQGDVDYQAGVIRKSLRLGTNVPIAKLVRQAFGSDAKTPVFILNDAQCAALAELHLGTGRRENSFLFINLGTNPGGGVILAGHLLVNSNGRNLGRVGHLCIDPHGQACRCGKRGCLDTYVSARSIVGLANKNLAAMEIFSPKELTQMADEGVVSAQEVWRAVAHPLALGVVNLVNFFGLELVVIGGGISLAGNWLFSPLQEMVNDRSRYQVKVCPSLVEARLASVFGATILAQIGYQNL